MVGANQVGRNHAGLRKRMGLFACLRSANRALPAAASDIGVVEQREREASALRDKIAELAAREAPPELLAQELNAALPEIDRELAAMQEDLFSRFDAVPFVSLRASIPRSVETHRTEVVALLEALLGGRAELLERLPRVEYLITMLSTDEDEGRRNIVHDPSTLTPTLESFSVDTVDPAELDAVAMELYQAATLDSDSENFNDVLRALRAKKQSVGLACLTPTVLRAVVTYNARMFNSVESLAEASRASDSALDEVFADPEEEIEEVGDDSIAEAVEEESNDEDLGDAPSALESVALQSITEALRARLAGETIGRRGAAERVAIVLDQKSLDATEIEAIRNENPGSEERIITHTTIVGLILRDLGPLKADLDELGIDQRHLSDAWVRELNEVFGQLISQMITDPKAYDRASQLSRIKAKHLLKPFNALNAAKRGQQLGAVKLESAKSEMQAIARAAVDQTTTRAPRSASRRAGDRAGAFGIAVDASRGKLIAAAALVAIAVGLTLANVVGFSPSDVKTVNSGSLRHTSPYLQSAYRNAKGRGGLLIGRVDSLFVELPTEEKIEAANEMVENFEIQGIREALLYDSRGMLQIHYAFGELNRPREGDRSTSRAPGGAAIRRTLSGERLDELESDEEEGEWDGWDDDF